MNTLILLSLTLTVVSAASSFLNAMGSHSAMHMTCPAPSGGIDKCIFIQGVNCVDDKECSGGKMCCPEGCGRVCKHPVMRKRQVNHAGQCPVAQSFTFFGHCVHLPGTKCTDDGDCADHQKCCHDGCTNICKDMLLTAK